MMELINSYTLVPFSYLSCPQAGKGRIWKRKGGINKEKLYRLKNLKKHLDKMKLFFLARKELLQPPCSLDEELPKENDFHFKSRWYLNTAVQPTLAKRRIEFSWGERKPDRVHYLQILKEQKCEIHTLTKRFCNFFHFTDILLKFTIKLFMF